MPKSVIPVISNIRYTCQTLTIMTVISAEEQDMLPAIKPVVTPVPIDLQSLVDSHKQPFVVVDNEYRIMAVNSAYERTFGASREQAVGQPCYKISHQKDAPCHESGEDCPHVNLFEIGRQDSCLHVHHDANNRVCEVRVTAYPLYGSMASCIWVN